MAGLVRVIRFTSEWGVLDWGASEGGGSEVFESANGMTAGGEPGWMAKDAGPAQSGSLFLDEEDEGLGEGFRNYLDW
jgi:hypothetical protein